MKTQCDTKGCEIAVKPGSRFGVCTICRGAVLRWLKRWEKHPAQVMDRRRKLRMYDDRLENVIDHKVVSIRKRKSA